MQEKIKTLAEKAGFYVPMFDPENEDNLKIEKFANLIVEELVRELDLSNENIPTPIQAGLNLAKVVIREHFKED